MMDIHEKHERHEKLRGSWYREDVQGRHRLPYLIFCRVRETEHTFHFYPETG
jgi:hypothetical protein